MNIGFLSSLKAAGSWGCLLRLPVVVQLRRALDLVALVAHANARLVVREVVNTLVDVFVNNRARLQKGFLDVGSGLGGGFHEDEAVLFGKHLAFVGGNLATRIKVAFVANQHD